jgi:hypothetical protein
VCCSILILSIDSIRHTTPAISVKHIHHAGPTVDRLCLRAQRTAGSKPVCRASSVSGKQISISCQWEGKSSRLEFSSPGGTYNIIKNMLSALKKLTCMQLAGALQQTSDAKPISGPQHEVSSPKKKRHLRLFPPQAPITAPSPSLRNRSLDLQARTSMLTIHSMKKKHGSTDDEFGKEANTETKGSKHKGQNMPNTKKIKNSTDGVQVWWKSQSKQKSISEDSAVDSTTTAKKCKECSLAYLDACTHVPKASGFISTPQDESSNEANNEQRTPIPQAWHDKDWDEHRRLRQELVAWRAADMAMEATPAVRAPPVSVLDRKRGERL